MLKAATALLNQFIPTALAVKGLEKINPRFKTFFANAGAAGYGTDRALNFLRNQLELPASRQNEQQLEQRTAQGVARPDEAAALQRLQTEQRPAKALGQAATLAAGIAGGIGGLSSMGGGQESPQAANPIDEISPELHQFLSQQIQSGVSALQASSLAYKDARFAKPIQALEKATRQGFPAIVSSIYGQGQPQQGPRPQQMSNVAQTPQGQQQQSPQQGQGDAALMAALQKILQM